MTFTTYQVADISTGYLEPSDLPLLLDTDAPHHLANVDGGFGSYFWVPDDAELATETEEQFRSFGLSERFITIMAELRKQGIHYVRFDGCGMDIEGLEPTDQEDNNG